MRGAAPLRALRIANPVVRAVLDSPAHRLLSRRLLVLDYRGHRSERAFRIPLQYAEDSDRRIVAVAVRPGRKLWWRSFEEPAPATLTLRGIRIEACGVLATGREREHARAAYVERHPRSTRVAQDAAIVVFTPRPG